MKIVLDISDLSTGRADGTTRYTYELARRLPQLSPHHSWTYLAPNPPSYPYNLLPTSYNLITSPWPKYWTQLRMPKDLFSISPDVLFMPIQQLPIIRPKKMKTVAVIHDLAIYRYPEQFTYKDWLLLSVFSAQVAREADHVIAVSHATAQDIAQTYGRTKNVHVIHHGVDLDMFYPNTEHISPPYKKPYILYVGQIQPRKNLVRLIEAFELLKQKHPDLQLVIAGSHGWYQKPIIDRAKTSIYAKDIHMPGRVEDEKLRELYWNAEAFVLPSLYEGFGMPILEAFACGCPVVTSNTSSMPEVAGDAAVLVHPEHSESIAHGIESALARKDELIKKGFDRVQRFTWGKTVQETLKVIEKIDTLK